MSEEGMVFGCIVGLYSGSQTYSQVLEHNKQAIERLPSAVSIRDNILVARSIFKVSMPEDGNIYHQQMIPFGMSVNHLDNYWEDWIIQFETLLKQLFWVDVYAHMEAENFVSLTEYHWRADISSMHLDPPQPVQNWEFSGGPRSVRLDYI